MCSGPDKRSAEGAEIETLKAEGVEEGRVWGGVVPLPSRLGGLEERRKFPSGVRCRAPAENEFWNI